MAEIQLPGGQLVLVDDEDFPLLSRHRWSLSPQGYAVACVGKSSTILMHRLVFGAVGKRTVDHINRNKLDNRKSNLRDASFSENLANVGKKKGRYSSQYKGVSYRAKENRWTAHINAGRKPRYLGIFKTEGEAAAAYNVAAKEAWGEAAYQNDIKTNPVSES